MTEAERRRRRRRAAKKKQAQKKRPPRKKAAKKKQRAKKRDHFRTKAPLRPGDRGPAVRKLQKNINATLGRRGFKWRKVREDAEFGHATMKSASLAAFITGLSQDQVRAIRKGRVTPYAFAILCHDKKRTSAHQKRERQRRPLVKKLRYHHNHPPTKGFATFDGRSVAPWMVGLAPGPDGKRVNWLQKSRDAGWDGGVVSGVRTPEYSESLCWAMCGAPSCSGTCAGRSSNHNCTGNCPYPTGAIDVSDYIRFAQIQIAIGSPLRNRLPNDRVHFSVSGN
jgi:hypothetical protein